MKHRMFRIVIVAILICALLVSWSPIRAKAVGVDQFVGVAVNKVGLYAQAGAVSTGAAVFAWVLTGLGLIVTTAQAIDLMNRYTEFSGELETSIYYYPDGSWSYGVDMGFVERVRAFLFDSGTLLVEQEFPYDDYVGYSQAFHDFYLSCLGHPYYFLAYSLTLDRWWCGYSDKSPFIATYSYHNQAHNVDIYGIECVDGSTFRYRTMNTDGSGSSQTSTGFGTITWWSMTMNGETVVSSDPSIDLGQVAPIEVPMPEAYPEWHTNARPASNPDTQEEITVLPIPLDPNTEELPDGATQSDAWQGTVADPLPDTGTVPDGSIAETPWEAFKKWISEGWKTIIQAIPTPDSIAEAVGNVIKSIFVPDADFITEKWNDIRSRFEFADSITATGEVLVNILDGLDPEPPVIYIDLGAAEGSYNIGSEVPFIDLRWYARYKPTMDLIVSAFLWLAFVWRLILKLPGIISGMPGEFVLMNLPVNLPHLGIGSGQRREELESGRNNRRLGDGH